MAKFERDTEFEQITYCYIANLSNEAPQEERGEERGGKGRKEKKIPGIAEL